MMTKEQEAQERAAKLEEIRLSSRVKKSNMRRNTIISTREEIINTIQARNDAERRYYELHNKIEGIALKLYKAICQKENRRCHEYSLHSFLFNEENDCIVAYFWEWYDDTPSTIKYIIPIYILSLEDFDQYKAIEELADIIVTKNKQEQEIEESRRIQKKREEELAELARLKAKYEQ